MRAANGAYGDRTTHLAIDAKWMGPRGAVISRVNIEDVAMSGIALQVDQVCDAGLIDGDLGLNSAIRKAGDRDRGLGQGKVRQEKDDRAGKSNWSQGSSPCF